VLQSVFQMCGKVCCSRMSRCGMATMSSLPVLCCSVCCRVCIYSSSTALIAVCCSVLQCLPVCCSVLQTRGATASFQLSHILPHPHYYSPSYRVRTYSLLIVAIPHLDTRQHHTLPHIYNTLCNTLPHIECAPTVVAQH